MEKLSLTITRETGFVDPGQFQVDLNSTQLRPKITHAHASRAKPTRHAIGWPDGALGESVWTPLPKPSPETYTIVMSVNNNK